MINAQSHRLDMFRGKDVCRKQFFFTFMDKLMVADTSPVNMKTYLADLQTKFC